jgi:hypothetical protein
MNETATATTVAAVSGVVVPTVAVGVIQAIGFGSAGVAAGSIAAGIQAGMGGAVASGSAFAIAQSLGALGAGSAIATVGIPLAAVGLVSYGIYRLLRR